MSTDGPNRSDFTPEGTGVDGQFKIGDDLYQEAKETLAAYLSALTENPQNHNAFPISPADPLDEFSLRQANGLPSEFTTGGNDGTEGFTDTFPEGDTGSESAVRRFENLSESRKWNMPPGTPKLSDFLDKNNQQDGHNILRDFVSSQEANEPGIGNTAGKTAFSTPSDAPPAQQKIGTILGRLNRFDPMPTSSPYIEGNAFTEPGIPISQGQFGVYDQNADRTTIAALRKMAMSTLLRSTGHRMGSGNPETITAAQLLNSTQIQRGAKKVNTEKTRVLNAYGAPDRPTLENAELLYNDVDGNPLLPRKSIGSLNSPFEPFEHAVVPQLMTAATAFVEILALGAVFAAIMTVIDTVAGSSSTPLNPAQMRKGQFKIATGAAKLFKHMGVPQTSQPMWRCICYGILAFFKIPVAGTPPPPSGPGGPVWIATWWTAVLASTGGDVVSLFMNAQKGSGYYASILRAIRIDLEQFLSDLSPTDPPVLYQTLMHMNSYSSWRFFCALAVMGDRYLDSITPNFPVVPSIDAMENNGQTRQSKSRARGGSAKLAWRHRAMPSLILLPQKYVNAYRLYGFKPNYAQDQMIAIGDRTNDTGAYWNSKGPQASSSGKLGAPPFRRKVIKYAGHRLPQEWVTQVEDELDSEYCPFYMHDLRTNEVIAFQAFIEDVKDSYSVSYAESAGYGRIDPVKIYQNTARSISLSWVMVATSKEDFDSMWWSINKLVSMCYPQFSMGKSVKAGTKKFVMPFSQIPTASPVIRLRVGDVIRSNYSRFNLARLFGMSEAIPAASAYSPSGGTTVETEEDIAKWEGAPFDLTYAEKAQAAQEMGEAEAEADYNVIIDDIFDHIEEQPSTLGDTTAGYLPGSLAGLGLGVAMLKANSSGYTCYDMDDAKSNPTGGYYAEADWLSMFPPPTATSGDRIEDTPFNSRAWTDGKVRILARRVSNEDGQFPSTAGTGTDPINSETDVNEELREGGIYAEYLVTWDDVDDAADQYGPVSAKGHTHAYVVTSDDMYPIWPEPAEPEVEPTELTLEQQVTDIYNFFRPEKNAIVRSFEVAGGRGLAGVITSFDMDWKDSMWDMSAISRRAPQMVKCSISFNPIHDIIPGLDNNGAMRAYNYPVGKINSGLAEDFYSPGAGRSVGGGRMSAFRGSFVDDDANQATQEGFQDSIASGYAGGGGDNTDP